MGFALHVEWEYSPGISRLPQPWECPASISTVSESALQQAPQPKRKILLPHPGGCRNIQPVDTTKQLE